MQIEDIGISGIIVVVVLAFAVIGFLKGLLRTLLAVCCIAVAGYAALRGYEHAHELTGPWIASPGPWMPKAVAVVFGICAFFICRYLLRFIANPLNKTNTGQKLSSGVLSSIFSLCSGLAILWLAFTGIRYGGSLAELRHLTHQLSSDEKHTEPWLARAKHALDASSIGKQHLKVDFLHQPDKFRLCQLITIFHHTPSRNQLLADPACRKVFTHPNFVELAYREEVKSAAESGRPRALFTSPYVESLSGDPEFRKLVQEIDPLTLLELMQ